MFDIILGCLAYVKGGSLSQGHSQGLKGYLWVGSEGTMEEDNAATPTSDSTVPALLLKRSNCLSCLFILLKRLTV